MLVGQFVALLQMLCLIWAGRAAASLTDRPHVVFKIAFNSFASRLSNSAWRWETTVMSLSAIVVAVVSAGERWHPVSTTVMTEGCVRLQCESLEKSTSVLKKLKGLIFRNVVFALCLKIRTPNQLFKKTIFPADHSHEKNVYLGV